MGSFSVLYCGGYPTLVAKNTYNSEIIYFIFGEEDFVSEKRKDSTRNPIFFGEDILKNKGSYTFLGYRQTVKICKERLLTQGINKKVAAKDFSQAKKIAHLIADTELPRNYTYKQYLQDISEIIHQELYEFDFPANNIREELMLTGLVIPGQSSSSVLYSILCLLEDDEIIEYDLSEVITNGWVKQSVIQNHDRQKILVLVEGKTDVKFIQKSIQVLFPHLLPYYHFLDFNEHKLEGGASALVKLIKAFIAAKVEHQIVALFDNDTAGISEMRKIDQSKLPNYIKVLTYPDISIAKKYPAIGPTGIKKQNINGLACGIEMYFGEDVLFRNGEFIPVRWKAYMDKEKKYQGEISDKDFVQKKYAVKLQNPDQKNFADMGKLLSSIFTAFK